jgi:hypothetical protein
VIRPGAGLAATLVTAIGGCLWALGGLGAALCAAQLGFGTWTGRWPVPAPAWGDAGRLGALVVMLFRFLPLALTLALGFHLLVAWLGFGLYARRAWARRATLAFCAAWAAVSGMVWIAVRPALADYAQRFPERAAFAATLSTLASEILILVLLLAGGLALLLTRRGVRAQFAR